MNKYKMICEYGCEKEAKFILKNGKYCCENKYQKCENVRKISSNRNKGKTNLAKFFVNNNGTKCSFGCGKDAKFIFKNGKYCCEQVVNSCISVKKRMSKSMSGKIIKGIPIQNSTILCEYGCDQIAKYKFKYGRYCCSEVWENCPESKKININNIKNLWKTSTYRNKTIKAIKDSRDDLFSKKISKQKLKEWNNPNSKLNSHDRNKKLSKSQTMGLEKLKIKYPIFIKLRGEENIKEDSDSKQIIIKCDFCNNWFIPEREYLYEATFRSTTSLPYFLMFCSEECFKKSGIKTKIKWKFNEEYKLLEKYRTIVVKKTEKNIRKYGVEIQNLHLRGKGFELDHKFSVIEGFKLNIDPDIISHVKNLEILTIQENKKKLGKSSISLEDLLKEIKKFNTIGG